MTGSHEVRGSIPLGSTNLSTFLVSYRRLALLYYCRTHFHTQNRFSKSFLELATYPRHALARGSASPAVDRDSLEQLLLYSVVPSELVSRQLAFGNHRTHTALCDPKPTGSLASAK